MRRNLEWRGDAHMFCDDQGLGKRRQSRGRVCAHSRDCSNGEAQMANRRRTCAARRTNGPRSRHRQHTPAFPTPAPAIIQRYGCPGAARVPGETWASMRQQNGTLRKTYSAKSTQTERPLPEGRQPPEGDSALGLVRQWRITDGRRMTSGRRPKRRGNRQTTSAALLWWGQRPRGPASASTPG